MDFVKILALIAVGIGVLFIVLWIFSAVYRRLRDRALKNDSQTPNQELHCALKYMMSGINLISERYFPLGRTSLGLPKYYIPLDEVVIRRSGVLLITLCTRGGKIVNDDRETWIQVLDDERYEFESPIEKSEAGKRALREVLDSHGYRDIRIYSVILLSDKTAFVVNEKSYIIQFSELEKFICDFNSTGTCDLMQQFYIKSALKNASMKESDLNEMKRKMKK